jgi:DNA/RNA endonuclease YhcR with UshA esterase domain
VKPTQASPAPVLQTSRSCLSVWRLVWFVGTLTFVLLLIGRAEAQKQLAASEAKDHIGETAKVCGDVVSTKYATSTKGRPTFLNLDRPYPSQVFTVLIWGSTRHKFGEPEKEFSGKRICVTGKVIQYRGVPEITADDPDQIIVEPKR